MEAFYFIVFVFGVIVLAGVAAFWLPCPEEVKLKRNPDLGCCCNKQLLKILRLRKPSIVFPVFRQGADGMLKFVLVLPAKSAVDVVSREVSLAVAGAEPVVVTLAGDALQTAEFSGEDQDAVVGALVDVDDAGNRSPAREFSFVLADTIAPAQPGEVALKVTAEA